MKPSLEFLNCKSDKKSDKVKTVCDRVRSVLQEQDDSGDNKRLLPILATLVRDGGQLEAALKKIKIVKGNFIWLLRQDRQEQDQDGDV